MTLGIPEGERLEDERRSEIAGLIKKHGEKELAASLLLYQAQSELASGLVTDLDLELTPDQLLSRYDPWSGHLAEIARMKVSPGSVIYRVWSGAPGFRAGILGKYKSRLLLSVAFQYHKLMSAGTPREFLFSKVPDVRMITDPKKAKANLERFRKAGYRQPLQKIYRPIIDIIYQESIGKFV